MENIEKHETRKITNFQLRVTEKKKIKVQGKKLQYSIV